MNWIQSEAYIFDMDGVLIDSVSTHARCWDVVAERLRRIHKPEHMQMGNGQTSLSYVQNVLQWTQDRQEAQRIVDEKENIYKELVDEEGVNLVDGARQLLQHLQEKKLPLAVGTSAPTKNADYLLEKAGIRSYFDGVVTAEDVERGKPDPEVFLKAAQSLGVEPAKCVVFEDAAAGIKAAKAGGMYVVALTTTQSAVDLQEAHAIYPSLDPIWRLLSSS